MQLFRKVLLLLGVFSSFILCVQAHVDLTEEILRKIFPQAEAFTARNKTLTSSEVGELERATGTHIGAHEREVVFYVAITKKEDGNYQSMGAVFVVHGTGPQGMIDVAVGYDLDSRVRGIVILENRNDPGIQKPQFLSQFTDKGLDDSLVLGKDIQFSGDSGAAEGLIGVVKKGMHLLRLVVKG